MFNSKDIYDPEWLELVFENRNKTYGAYELRKHYPGTVLRAMVIAVVSLSAIFIVCILLFNHKVKALTVHNNINVINQPVYVIPETANKKPSTTPHQSAQRPAKPVEKVTTYQQTIEPLVAQMPGVETNNTKLNVTAPDKLPANNNNIVDNGDADIKPIPPGGAEEWSKYLEANLHYPAEARQQRISGKVWLSFIVEKDGRLSNITIDRPAGHGFDEEAVRVLKQSPIWAPGLQNGQTVRVKCSLPINFYIQHL